MITSLKQYSVGENGVHIEVVGLSSDEKPTTMGSRTVANGSAFLEMDTGDLYLYDEDGSEWIKQ
jgi:hypothetical protein